MASSTSPCRPGAAGSGKNCPSRSFFPEGSSGTPTPAVSFLFPVSVGDGVLDIPLPPRGGRQREKLPIEVIFSRRVVGDTDPYGRFTLSGFRRGWHPRHPLAARGGRQREKLPIEVIFSRRVVGNADPYGRFSLSGFRRGWRPRHPPAAQGRQEAGKIAHRGHFFPKGRRGRRPLRSVFSFRFP